MHDRILGKPGLNAMPKNKSSRVQAGGPPSSRAKQAQRQMVEAMTGWGVREALSVCASTRWEKRMHSNSLLKPRPLELPGRSCSNDTRR
jgi:hypothetical protein